MTQESVAAAGRLTVGGQIRHGQANQGRPWRRKCWEIFHRQRNRRDGAAGRAGPQPPRSGRRRGDRPRQRQELTVPNRAWLIVPPWAIGCQRTATAHPDQEEGVGGCPHPASAHHSLDEYGRRRGGKPRRRGASQAPGCQGSRSSIARPAQRSTHDAAGETAGTGGNSSQGRPGQGMAKRPDRNSLMAGHSRP